MAQTNEVAVITGGASGFGLALSRLCASRGMAVAILDLDAERATTEAEAIAATHDVSMLGLGVDVSNAGSVDVAASAVADRFGHADLVISNVGVQLFGSTESLTDDEWRWILDVNVIGSAHVAKAFVPLLRDAPRGRLAFTTSSSVLSAASHLAAYQTSKFAVWGLAESLRMELARDEIAVSVIFPSGMITRHLETSGEAQPEHLRRPVATEGDLAAMASSNPGMTTAIAAPEDIAQHVMDALLSGDRYVITHGDLVEAVTERSAELRHAAESAR
jgi:NAD(P)-dependent dehydrogenase (short-subunit alcohol dehydrogenase family)